MANWHGNRHEETYTYKRVSWEGWQECEDYGTITEGSVELSAESELKVSGSFSFEGGEAPDVNDLMRIYYSFVDDYGETAWEPVATLLCEYTSTEYFATEGSVNISGSLEGVSVLYVLQNKIYGQPFTVTRNTNCIYKAQEMIRQCGLNVEYTPGNKVLSADHTFQADNTYLDIVNWLCRAAGYNDAFPDAYGTVQLQPYENMQRQDGSVVFANDEQSIMYPEVEADNDWQTTPNVVKLLYNTDTACVVAQAKNINGSKASLANRGNREITYYEETSEIDTDGSVLTNLINLAETTLREQSSDIEYVIFSHAYMPIQPYDPITVQYSDLEWTGNADNVSIELSPSTKTQTKVKRVLYDVITVEKSGEILRGGNSNENNT